MAWEALEEEGGRPPKEHEDDDEDRGEDSGETKLKDIVATLFQEAITRANGQQYVRYSSLGTGGLELCTSSVPAWLVGWFAGWW